MVRTKRTASKQLSKNADSPQLEVELKRKPMTASNHKRLQSERQKLELEKKQEEGTRNEAEDTLNESEETNTEGDDEGEEDDDVEVGSDGEQSNEDEESNDGEDSNEEEFNGEEGSESDEQANVQEGNEPEKDAEAVDEGDERHELVVVDERQVVEHGKAVVEEQPSVVGKKSRKRTKEQPSQNQEDDTVHPSLLFAYKDHIAHKIWNSKAPKGESRIVKVHSHVGTQRLWDLDGECQFVKDIVMGSSFYPLILHAHEKLDKVLINAFIERFYPETNTFHLPFGEMMITIDEVFHIIGLPAEGNAVTGALGGSRSISFENVYSLLEKNLGVGRPTSISVLAGKKKIRLEWLRSQFSNSKESDTQERKNHCATAYLLYTIGCLVCGDKSGNKVGVHFLQCLGDLSQVHKYSWATACLSWLIHSLGQTTRKDVQQFSGCMTLFQVWIFEHFPVLRRHRNCVGAEVGDVRAAFYFAMEQGSNLNDELVSIRERIDDLQSCDIVWDPYKDKRDAYIFQQCALFNGPIVCFETAELYLPQRTLRQFDYVQPIPTTSFTLDKKRSKSSTRSFKAIYHNVGDLGWSEWNNHLLHESLTSQVAVNPSDCVESYSQWYYIASHPIVTNPSKRITTLVADIDSKSLLVRIKRRLSHIANYIKSCPPNVYRDNLLKKVEQIENPEPLDLYGEHGEVDEDVGPSKKSKRTRDVRGSGKKKSQTASTSKSTRKGKRGGRK